MRKRKNLKSGVLILFFLTAFFCRGEQWSLSGFVLDSRGETLPGVIVKLKSPAGATVAFCSSNGEGRFTLKTLKNVGEDFKVTFSMIGFKEKIIGVSTVAEGMKVVMNEAPKELKEVIVRRPPISQLGDTLTYDVGAFKSATDRNIEDIIKKLPGIEVSSGGGITYNGEPINRFYIEGLDLVSRNYTLATRNISPDDIQSINVYENHQPKRILQGIEHSDRAAINLKMKKNRMLKPVGYVRGGAGFDDDGEAKWLSELYGMLIAPAMQSIVSVKGNNWGTAYGSDNSGSENDFTVAADLLGENPFGTARISKSRYFDNKSATASVNGMKKLSDTRKLSFNSDYRFDDRNAVNEETITYGNIGDSSIVFMENIDNSPRHHHVSFRGSYEDNSDKRYVSEVFTFRGHFRDVASLIRNSGSVDQQTSTDNFSLKNSFNTTFNVFGNLMTVASDIEYGRTPSADMTVERGASGSFTQRLSATSFHTLEKLGYLKQISAQTHIGLSGKFRSNYNRFTSVFDKGSVAERGNDLKGYDLTTTLEPEFKTMVLERLWISLKTPLELWNIDYDSRTDNKKYSTDKFFVGVNLNISKSFTKKINASADFKRTVSLGNVRDYITHPIYISFRQQNVLGGGTSDQTEGYSGSVSFNYRNPLKSMFFNFIGFYRHSKATTLKGSDISPDEVVTEVVNRSSRKDMSNATFAFSKLFRDIHTTVKINLSTEYLTSEIMRQGNLMGVKTWFYHLKGDVNSDIIPDRLNITMDFSFNPSVRKINGGNRSRSDDFEFNGGLSVFPIKKLELFSKVNVSCFTISGESDKWNLYLTCGSRLRFSKFDLEINCKNLSNSRDYSYSYYVNSDCYSYSYRLRPFEILASLKYSF